MKHVYSNRRFKIPSGIVERPDLKIYRRSKANKKF